MTTTTKRIPLYLKEIYGDFYTNENLYAFFDKPWVNFILTCGFSSKLTKALLKELKPGQKVLQLGCTFGNQIFETATLLGKKGKLDILDVSSLQIKRCKFKIGRSFPQVGFICQNANTAVKNNYDAVILYGLLHEVPHVQKAKILQAALDSIKEGGKVVIIDYHKPKIWHPFRWPVKLFNRLYQPFAEVLWDRDIDTFVKDKSKYFWRKTQYDAGMYQKVVIEKKKSGELTQTPAPQSYKI